MSHIQTPGKPPPLHQGSGFALGRGSDFARVVDGAGLSLLAPTVPRALDYDIVLRYETQVSGMVASQVGGWCQVVGPYTPLGSKRYQGISLVVQWLRINLPLQGTQIKSLAGELRFPHAVG